MRHAGRERGVDIRLAEPAPGHHPAWKPFGDDAADRLDLVTAHRGRSNLDLIDARLGERPRDGDLVARRKSDARRLFAIAQGRVVEIYARVVGVHGVTQA